ncbi:MAG: M15 family metallopeptidase [Neisseria sp.]|nr:M15 family metallopeptidase [Neisseria sp.]
MNTSHAQQAVISRKPLDWAAMAAQKIIESGEKLRIVQESERLKIRPAYFEQGIAHALPHIVLRESVAARLQQAADGMPSGFGLLVLDGWRPIAVQQALRAQFRQTIVAQHPNWTAEQVLAELNDFVADPDNAAMCPPHNTGGSVDVTLLDLATGKAVEMGTAFDETHERSHSAALEVQTAACDERARIARRVLIHGMAAAGFSNLPTEWWHFDYGNQNWAYFYDESHAIYGQASFE